MTNLNLPAPDPAAVQQIIALIVDLVKVNEPSKVQHAQLGELLLTSIKRNLRGEHTTT